MHWIIFLGVGALSGLITGLFGGSGGWFLVPALIFTLPYTGVDAPELIKIAIATALTCNVFTTIAAARAYAERGGVHWRALCLMFPGTALGVIGGAALAAHANVTLLTCLFAAAAIYMAFKMTGGATGSRLTKTEPLPGLLNLSTKGLAVGGMVGAAGGGGLSVPMFLHYMPITRAIGSAAVLSIPISAMAVATYALADAPQGCGPSCLGYIYLPAVCTAGLPAVLFAPLGSALAHSLPVSALRRVFAAALVLAALNLTRKNLPPAETLIREAKAGLVSLRPSLGLCQGRAPMEPVRFSGSPFKRSQ
jgi:uncharacterized membrane protein YfcA